MRVTNRGGSRFARRRARLALLFCLPAALMVLGLVAYPAGYAVALSFWNRGETRLVGFANYIFLLNSRTFQKILWNTCVYALTAVGLKLVLGVVFANLIEVLPARRQPFWRGLLLLPWIIPIAISTIAWRWLLDPAYGALPTLFDRLGVGRLAVLADPTGAWLATIAVNVWHGAPLFMVMFLAASKSIPRDQYEAANIDGASSWQQFRHITMPGVANIMLVTTLFSLILTFATFDIVRVLTGGGPRDSTQLLATYAFRMGLESGDIPLGAAISLFLVPPLAASSWLILRHINARARAA